MRNLPEGWKETTLGELVVIKYGKDHKHLADGDYPLYGSGGIMRHVEKPLYDKESILIPRKGTLSNLFYVDEPFWSVDTIFYTEIDKEKVKPLFLFYKLKTIDLAGLNVGSAVPSLTTKVLNPLELSIPPLPEQKAIADMLSSFDEKIELLREQNKTLETLAQTIFKEWFVHFNFPDPHGKPYRNNGGAMVESELGLIPQGWRVGKLGELIDKVIDNRGKTPPTKEKDSNSYPLVEVNSIIGTNRAINLQSVRKYVSPDTYKSWFRKGHPKKNDVLISTVGSIGELAVLNDEKVSIAQNIVALRSHDFGLFLFQLLQQNIRRVKTLDISSVQPSIKVPHMLNLEVVIPIETLRSQFEELISPISEKVARNVIQIQSLSKTRDTLLPKLMCGQVKVQGETV